jgi:hypothetical protein
VAIGRFGFVFIVGLMFVCVCVPYVRMDGAFCRLQEVEIIVGC